MTEDTIQPAASGEFTHSLFDTAGSLGWHPHTPATASDASESDETDADDGIGEGDDIPPPASDPAVRGSNCHLDGDRTLAHGWPARARDNIAAIGLLKALEQSGRAPSPDEQARLLRFTGFGATDLAQNWRGSNQGYTRRPVDAARVNDDSLIFSGGGHGPRCWRGGEVVGRRP